MPVRPTLTDSRDYSTGVLFADKWESSLAHMAVAWLEEYSGLSAGLIGGAALRWLGMLPLSTVEMEVLNHRFHSAQSTVISTPHACSLSTSVSTPGHFFDSRIQVTSF